jgi:hypothetical protein
MVEFPVDREDPRADQSAPVRADNPSRRDLRHILDLFRHPVVERLLAREDFGIGQALKQVVDPPGGHQMRVEYLGRVLLGDRGGFGERDSGAVVIGTIGIIAGDTAQQQRQDGRTNQQ